MFWAIVYGWIAASGVSCGAVVLAVWLDMRRNRRRDRRLNPTGRALTMAELKEQARSRRLVP